jgi:sugar phosphate isomerase/epimerase
MTRREWFRKAAGAACAVYSISAVGAIGRTTGLSQSSGTPAPRVKSPFKLSVITDEISQDFEHALDIASREFGLSFVEIRTLWSKNIVNLDTKELTETRRLLDKYGLKVTDIGSPLFKIDWPGAPKSEYAPKDFQSHADFTYAQQDEVLDRAIEAGKELGTNRVRCFDFWRLEDPKPYRQAIDERLLTAAHKAEKQSAVLLLENEYACNTATGVEAARTLQAVQSSAFFLNWDPGNAAYRGEVAFPDGYAPIPKDRIGHMHLKDVRRKPDGSYAWEAMGRGLIDYTGQFKALLKDGYTGTMSLETHWTGAGSPEECSRQSMAGTKDLLRKAGALAT